ncbi:FAD-binding protein [Pseudonocardia sp.]|uniref:FAD-binding protein n=1 Tax=Pseudonocardia sp. TaxID=60912 RepID=UPI0039C9C4F7
MSIPAHRTAPATNPRRVAHLLDSRLHGRLHLPGDAGYDPGGHGTPDVVVDAATAADVRATVRAARESGLPLTVLATGHGTVAAPEGGILLRTSRMAQVLVDPDRRIARVGPGARWGEVVTAAERSGSRRPPGTPRRSASSATRSAAGCPGCRASTASPPTACCAPSSPRRTGASSSPTGATTPTCSGRSAAGAATSGSSQRWSCGCTRCRASTAGRPSSRSTGPSAPCGSSPSTATSCPTSCRSRSWWAATPSWSAPCTPARTAGPRCSRCWTPRARRSWTGSARCATRRCPRSAARRRSRSRCTTSCPRTRSGRSSTAA